MSFVDEFENKKKFVKELSQKLAQAGPLGAATVRALDRLVEVLAKPDSKDIDSATFLTNVIVPF